MKKFIVMFAAIVAAVNLSAQTTTDTKQATCGQTATITATADAGYEFEKWSDGNTDNPRVIEVNSELSVYEYTAVFKAKTMTITATANDGDWGTVAVTGSVLCGEQATLTATAASKCYRFVKWSDEVTENPRTVTVANNDAANTYQAVFEQVNFDVKAVAGANGSVSISIE